MGAFNAAITHFFDLICTPFRAFDPIWALLFISLLAGVLLLWIFGKVSNQTAIKKIRNIIVGNLWGVWVYQDHVRVVLNLQNKIVANTLRYMLHTLIPIAILIGPAVLIMSQLNLRLAVRPLAVGETALVKFKVRDAASLTPRIELELPEGLSLDSPGVHMPEASEVAWRVKAEAPGEYVIKATAGGETLAKQFVAGDRWAPVSTRRTGTGFFDSILYPGEPPIAQVSIFESAEIVYQPLEMTMFRIIPVNWLVGFFILSMVFGFAFKDVLGVEI